MGARWNETEGTWSVKVKDLITNEVFEDWCHFMITGSGILKWVLIRPMRKSGG